MSEQSYTRIVENLVLTSTLVIDGPEWNNTLVRNVTIRDVPGDGINVLGDGITLRNVSNVRIENCTIENVAGTGIRLRSTGSTSDVTIIGNTIKGTLNNGISSAQRDEIGIDHLNLRILNNTIDTTGRSLDGGRYHGIYVQTSDTLVEGNMVLNSLDGNGISVRSSGIVRGNTVDKAAKSGIGYYSDHVAGPSDTLLVENNIVKNWGASNPSSYYGVDLKPVQNADWSVNTFIIENNRFVGPEAMWVGVDSSYRNAAYSISVSGSQTYTDPNTPPTASLALDPIASDNVINIAEASSNVAVTGSVGGDVKAGDAVTLTVNNTAYAGVVATGGTFSISVQGSALAADSDRTVEASVTTTDAAGNSISASSSKTYTVDLIAPTASILLNNITSDNVLASSEAGSNVAVTGSVGGDVKAGDTVTLTVNNTAYAGVVATGGTFSILVQGSALAADSDRTVEASVTTTDAAGNSISTTSSKTYTVDTTLPKSYVGGTGNDTLVGDGGNNTLAGKGGNDTLTGGGGQDTFVFDTKLNVKNNIDTITDFSPPDDMMYIDNAVFTKAGSDGALNPNSFWAGAKANDSSDRIIYDPATGALSYDADGTGATKPIQFAKLSAGLSLTAADFWVI